MKKIALCSLGAFIALLVFMLAALPASQVLHRITLPPSVSLSGVSGTVWTGSAEQVIADGMAIDSVSWSIQPWSLLLGKLSAKVKGGNMRDTDAIALSGNVSVSLFNFSHVQSQDLTLYLPSDQMIAKAKLPIRVNMGGRFKLQVDELAFAPLCQKLMGKGDWLNASIVLPNGNTSLGSFSADLACAQDDIQMTVNEPNLLGLSFVSVMSPDLKRFNVTGKFKPDESLPREIHQAGRFFGSPGADGYTAFEL